MRSRDEGDGKKMKIAVVGLGLIGGSFGYAIKKYTQHTVVGINRSNETLLKAKQQGAVDIIGDTSYLPDADIVILGLYPQITVNFIRENAKKFKKGAVVIDTCGIKTKICNEITPVSEEYGFVFIGGHPMAGKERFGFDAAEAELFKGASMILTPVNGEQRLAADNLKSLFYQLGFGNVVITAPAEHDRIIAFTSQIPHVLANAYVKSPAASDFSGFSAGSFRDVSRVAKLNVPMWTELFLENREALTEQIDILIQNISDINNAIKANDNEKLYELLEEGSKIKEVLNTKDAKR